MDRAGIVHENFLRRCGDADFPAGAPPCEPLDKTMALSIFRSACLSRALDRESRSMQAAGQGYYTIGSSGHEGMAAVAAALHPTDMAFLHYRDAAFQIQRAEQVPGQTIARDMLLSFACSSDDPISGGRHKVLGSKALNIPPQTSTIASHLPKAVGAAYSIGLARRLKPPFQALDNDALILCSFGDASVNHSTAQGAFNMAQWTAYQSVPLPILFLCEDNGIGISTRTPAGWIWASFAQRPSLRYFAADGRDIYETYRVAAEAAEYVRATRKPAFLHLRMVRLYGHAGADVPTAYMSTQEIETEEAGEPLLHMARQLIEAGALDAREARKIYEETSARVARIAAEVIRRPRLGNAAEVMASLIPPARKCPEVREVDPAVRADAFGSELAHMGKPQTMGKLINWGLTDLMLRHGEIVMLGEDIGQKGGNYGITQRLSARFGRHRVIDTLLDEQSILVSRLRNF